MSGGGTSFHELHDYVAIPRVTELRLAPDGTWLAVVVQTLAPDRKKYLTSIWRIDAAGAATPRRLTRSVEGEGNPRFLPDGSLLFTSKRPREQADTAVAGRQDGTSGRPGSAQPGGDKPALWLLPAGGGEAVMVAAPPGGVAGVETAARSAAAVLSCAVLPRAGRGIGNVSHDGGPGQGDATGESRHTLDDDARLRTARAEAGVTAILHESVPVRYWDHDLGPDQLRLFAADVPAILAGQVTCAASVPVGSVAGAAGSAEARGAGESSGAPDPVAAAVDGAAEAGGADPAARVVAERMDEAEPGGSGAGVDSARMVHDATALRDLTPEHGAIGATGTTGRALDEQPFDVAPDGATVVTGWWLWDGTVQSRAELVAVDVATGRRTPLLSADGFDFHHPRVSPDGRFVACLRRRQHTPDAPGDVTLVVAPLTVPDTGERRRTDAGTSADQPPGDAGVGAASAGQTGSVGPGGGRDLLPDFDRWAAEFAWATDSRSVYFTADDRGRRPVFVVRVDTGEVSRVTADDGAYTDLNVSPDGRYLYALRSSVAEPPTPIRLDLADLAERPGTGSDGTRPAGTVPDLRSPDGAGPVRLACPGTPLALPGRLTEIETSADDGTPVRSWLVLPDGASAERPAPLLLWVHGGPMMTWNSWSWRWNPWLMAARGYAVLLPDPALSTGYGQDFIARGYHEWGPRPFADLMAATDAAVARPDIDATRTAMMGGSYGGYMANWIAGHTDRFRAIVSHASLWVLDQMFGTTDHPMFWRPQFGDPLTSPARYELNSPHRHIAAVRTPMLVIHGNKDYRVPIGEALRLWWDLTRSGADAKFLYFPDENHWILGPGHATVWYETVFAFLAEHVLDQPWRRPDLL